MGEKIIDYISGQLIEARPEEVNATQPFSKMLVEDYGYEKEDIITRPQFRVKRNPSDKKGYRSRSVTIPLSLSSPAPYT